MIARAVTVVAVLSASVAAVAASTAATPRPTERDDAAQAWNVLVPGQAGGAVPTRSSTDQVRLYDALTPRGDDVGDADLRRYFKPAPLGLGPVKATSTERPRRGVTIQRDRWGVPHVTGTKDTDVAFGAGWVTAQDRRVLLELLRGPARLAALDAPGVGALDLAFSGRTFVASGQTEAFLARQLRLLARLGSRGRELLRLIDAYVAGINARYRREQPRPRRWTRLDVVAVAGLIGSAFGSGGGDEARRAAFLALLQERLGAERGRRTWEDLRLRDDPEARVVADGVFGYGERNVSELGNIVVDPRSVAAADAPRQPAGAVTPKPVSPTSNALLVAAKRSATGRPLLVAGPPAGYAYPGLLLELDLRGGGFEARGAAFPGLSFGIFAGRGPDYAWSATEARLDLVDEYVETLCDGSDVKYLHLGSCRTMTTFDAGVLRGAPGTADERVVFHETVHGPVVGYATVEGVRVAIASKRSTRGRELLSLPFVVDMSTAAPRSADDFVELAAQVELGFNWLYADDRDIAQFTSGRLPVRPSSVDPGLPTKGTGEYEWRGFLPAGQHPQVANPQSGAILNWGNKPARGYAASAAEWSWGPVQHVDLLWQAVQERRRHSLGSLVAAMNRAATQDLRAVRVWPVVRAALSHGLAPSPRAADAVDRVDAWVAGGAQRLDRDLDGALDAAGVAILDAAWPLLADGALGDLIGPLTVDLAALLPRDDAPSPAGSAYGEGWYSYLDKDLRALLGFPVARPFGSRYCGRGDPQACAATLWAAIARAVAALEAAQGPDPSRWRAGAVRERIAFAPGALRRTMRWTSRPAFQQAISFRSHRPSAAK